MDLYGSFQRGAHSLAIFMSRSAIPLLFTRESRSRTASVTAVVILSPVKAASSCTIRCVSSFLILRLMVEFYHDAVDIYQFRRCISKSGDSCTPNSKRGIYHPPWRGSDSSQNEWQKIPARDVLIIPVIVRHGICAQPPCLRFAERERDDVLEPQPDCQARAHVFSLINLQRQPERERCELDKQARGDKKDSQPPCCPSHLRPQFQQ